MNIQNYFNPYRLEFWLQRNRTSGEYKNWSLSKRFLFSLRRIHCITWNLISNLNRLLFPKNTFACRMISSLKSSHSRAWNKVGRLPYRVMKRQLVHRVSGTRLNTIRNAELGSSNFVAAPQSSSEFIVKHALIWSCQRHGHKIHHPSQREFV